MSFAGDAGTRPPNVVFVNLRTGEELAFPFMPTELTERIVVNYAKKNILGMSHEPLQYGNTSNYSIDGLDFFFRGTPNGPGDDFSGERVNDARRYLMSLCYSSEAADSVQNGDPPRVLFLWPNIMSLTCKLEQLEIKHEKYAVNGMLMNYRAKTNLVEIRDARLTSEDVRAFGTRRPSDAAQGRLKGRG